MSRIGKAPITLGDKVSATVDNGLVVVKGPKGELSRQIDTDFEVKVEEGVLTVDRPTEQKRHKALHGLYRSLINNMVVGVTEGYKKELQLVGVGYRAVASGQTLELSLGYSHPIYFQVPPEVKPSAISEKGKDPIVVLESTDKQLIGEVAAKLRELRKIEPYKGKGVRFKGEIIRKKAGKAAAKK